MRERLLKAGPMLLLTMAVVAMCLLWVQQRSIDRGQWRSIARTYQRVEYEAKQTAVKTDAMENQLRLAAEVIDLPESSDAWYLSVFVHDDWQKRPQEAALVSWFTADPRLARLRDATHDRLYTESNPMYQSRFKASVPKLPAVALQRPDGGTAYKVGGDIPMPVSSDELANDLGQIFKRWKCPCPTPFRRGDKKTDEEESPPPPPPNIPVIVSDVRPEPVQEEVAEPVQLGFPKWAVFLVGGVLAAIAGGLSIFYNIKQHS